VFRAWYLNQAGAQKWKTLNGWYHIDQNVRTKPNLECIQGIVSLYDQDKSTGSTVFVPGSHRFVHKIVPKILPKSDFVMIEKAEFDYPIKRKKILLCCKSGDLVLWDSRLIHCNSPAILSLDEMRKIHFEKLKISKVTKHQNDEEKKRGK